MSDCIRWHLYIHDNGYGQANIPGTKGKHMNAHRFVWVQAHGEIPEGMVLDHLCHNPSECSGGVTCKHRRCVNPDHLALVTEKENSQKSVRVYEFREECINGHKVKKNLGITPKGKRYCITCNKEQKMERYLRLKDNPTFKAKRAKNARELRVKRKAGI